MSRALFLVRWCALLGRVSLCRAILSLWPWLLRSRRPTVLSCHFSVVWPLALPYCPWTGSCDSLLTVLILPRSSSRLLLFRLVQQPFHRPRRACCTVVSSARTHGRWLRAILLVSSCPTPRPRPSRSFSLHLLFPRLNPWGTAHSMERTSCKLPVAISCRFN